MEDGATHHVHHQSTLAWLEEQEHSIIKNLSLSTLSKFHAAARKEKKESCTHRLLEKARKFHTDAHDRETHRRLYGQFRSELHALAAWFLRQPWLDAILGFMIVFNLVIVVIETDTGATGEAPPGWIKGFSWVILLTFTLELSLRLFVLECGFWLEAINVFDFMIVAADLLMSLIELFAGPILSVSVLRVVRLCKLARVAQAFHVCTELRLLLAGLLGCMKAIFWGTVLLALFLLIWSVVAVQFLHPLNQQLADEGKYSDCERCARAYGSVFDATLTFFQQIVAGDSWGMVTVTVIENYPETVFIYGPLFLSVGLAVLNLILGVVVDVASQARGQMQGELEQERLISKMELRHQLMDVCKKMDTDESGKLDQTELKQGYADNEDFRKALAGIGITADDLDILWTILDENRTGKVTYSAFVSYCYKMKTSHEEFMLAYIKYYVTIIKAQIIDEIACLRQELHGEDERLAQVEREVLAEEREIQAGIESVETTEKNIEKSIEEVDEAVMKLESRPINTGLRSTAVSDAKGSKQSSDAKGHLTRKSDGRIGEYSTRILDPQEDVVTCYMAKENEPNLLPDWMMEGNKMILDALQSLSIRQEKLFTAVEEVKLDLSIHWEKPHQTSDNSGVGLLVTPKLGPSSHDPSDRGAKSYPPFGCCGSSARANVMNVMPSTPEAAQQVLH